MYHKQLILLLNNLPPLEISAFHRHLVREYAGEKVALDVFRYLLKMKQHSFRKTPKIEEEEVYRKIFKGTATKEIKARKKKFQNAESDLYQWLQDFLIVQNIKKDKRHRQVIWLQYLEKKIAASGKIERKQLKEVFSIQASKFYKQAKSKPLLKAEDSFEKLAAGYFYWNLLAQSKPMTKLKQVQECAAIQETCLEILRLRLACVSSRLKAFTALAPAKENFNSTNGEFLRAVYQALWQMTETGDEKHFNSLEKLLETNGALISPEEISMMIQHIQGFSAVKSRDNDQSQIQILNARAHRINRIGLEKGVFGQISDIPTISFCNLIAQACLAEEFTWATEVISRRKEMLPDESHRASILLAEATYANLLRDFKQIIEKLEGLQFSNAQEMIFSNVMLVRAYYATNAERPKILKACIDLAADASKAKLGSFSTAASNFAKIVRLLVLKRSSKEYILKKINTSKHIHLKDWLIGNLEDYIPEPARRSRNYR